VFTREIHSLIRTILETAFKEGIVPRNYAKAASPPKKEQTQVKAISMKHLNTFFEKVKEQGGTYPNIKDERIYEYGVFYSLLLALGCRIGELSAISWNSVDFENCCVEINQHWVKDGEGSHIEVGTKTFAGKRSLYLDSRVMKMLSDYREYYNKKAAEHGSKWNCEINAVFSSPLSPGNYLDPQNARYWLTAFLKDNNLPHITPHQFRHTSISLQLDSGINFVDVSKRAGHARPDVTLSLYAHTMRNNDIHCCEAVSGAISTLTG
jgi:integrase